MKAAIIAALAIPVLSATAQGYTADYNASRQKADEWQSSFEQVNADLTALGVDLAAPSGSAEIPETQDTVAVADKGLFFDTAKSALVYLGNVRLRDSRAHINATEQLHIYLQNLAGDKSDNTDNPPGASPRQTTPAQAASATPAQAPAPVAAEPAPAPLPPADTGNTAETPAEPALINTHYAVADSVNNNIFLYSPAGGEEILMQQGQNVVRITPSATTPARILADPQGNIMLEGGLVDLCLVDKEGSISKLKSQGGHVYYQAATHTLHAPGKTQFTNPEGTLDCEESLCVKLTPAAPRQEAAKGFMSQFSTLQFEGIDTATASGRVVLTGTAAGERPAMRAEGDTLIYNGKTGECSLVGEKCRLVYGGYDAHADEGIHLLENGDIELRGSAPHGTYERESDTPGQVVKGSFKASSNIVFHADSGTISTEKGIYIADAEADFSCTGPAHLVLSPKEPPQPQERKAGMPNLAITGYSGISRLQASGNVLAHRFAPGTRQCVGELKARTVESDMLSGETLLTGEPGEPLVALYEGNRIVAVPASGQSATMQMLANGDLKLNGETITATMVNDDGTTTANCRDYVRLIRAEDRLETGSSTVLKAPTAILTTNGPMSALLTPPAESGPAAQPARTGFAAFRFRYNGISEATTDSGCTLQTEQGSMQCTGPVRVVMETENKNPDSMLGGMKYATAAGDVAVAGKDNTGRLIRATGDLLTIDAATGMKVLSGKRVTVGDAFNTHIITGEGAAIRIDARNNVRINGSNHKTHATKVRQQLNRQNNTKIK